MEMRIDAIGIVPGKWEFKFPVAMEKVNLVQEPKITKSYKDISTTVKKVILAQSATNFKMEMAWPPHKYFADYRVYDDRGMMLQNLSNAGLGDTVNGREVMRQSVSFAPVKGNPKYLVIRPVFNPTPDSPGERTSGRTDSPPADIITELTGKLPLTISQGKVGSLTITGVEYLPDKTRIHYEVKGSDPYNQAWTWWIRDGRGKDFSIHTGDVTKPEPESEEKYAFVLDFPAFEKGEKLKIVTRQFDGPAFVKELEVKIPLEW